MPYARTNAARSAEAALRAFARSVEDTLPNPPKRNTAREALGVFIGAALALEHALGRDNPTARAFAQAIPDVRRGGLVAIHNLAHDTETAA